MRRSGWMAGVKALAATTALACVAIAASVGSKADIYNYTYSNTGIGSSYRGTFDATITGIGSQISSSGSISITNATGVAFRAGFGSGAQLFSVFGINGTLTLNSGVGSFSATLDTMNGSMGSGAQGNVVGTASSFSFGSALSGLFSAVDTTLSSGGGGGGGGGNSGGAPSPEVNASLGILLAGATFVFLRRKRGGRQEAVAD